MTNYVIKSHRLTKDIKQNFSILVDKTKDALDLYKKLYTFIEGYLKFKNIDKIELLEND